jgi:hypothetical protein
MWAVRSFGFLACATLIAVPSTLDASCCTGQRGNIDCSADNTIDIGDLTVLIDFLYVSNAPLCCADEANTDNDPLAQVDIGDLTALVNFLYVSGSALAMCEATAGGFVGGSSCKSWTAYRLPSDTSADLGCITYTYDDNYTLTIKHVNAGFNCCPVLAANVFVIDDTIKIHELDSVINPCMCLCLFDMDYEITNLAPGIYWFIVAEPYRPNTDPALQFELDLSMPSEGVRCVPRTQYPWGYFELPPAGQEFPLPAVFDTGS